MASNKPPWGNWIKDPEKAEKIFIIYMIVIIAINLLLFFGFAFFIYLLVKGKVGS